MNKSLIRLLLEQGYTIKVNRIKGRLYLYAVKTIYLGPVTESEVEHIKQIISEVKTELKTRKPMVKHN